VTNAAQLTQCSKAATPSDTRESASPGRPRRCPGHVPRTPGRRSMSRLSLWRLALYLRKVPPTSRVFVPTRMLKNGTKTYLTTATLRNPCPYCVFLHEPMPVSSEILSGRREACVLRELLCGGNHMLPGGTTSIGHGEPERAVARWNGLNESRVCSVATSFTSSRFGSLPSGLQKRRKSTRYSAPSYGFGRFGGQRGRLDNDVDIHCTACNN